MVNDYDFFALAFLLVPIMSFLACASGLKRVAAVSIALFGLGFLAYGLCVVFDVFYWLSWGHMLIAALYCDIICFALAACIIAKYSKRKFKIKKS